VTVPTPERQVAFLELMPNAVVATIRRDGLPQLTPNWYLWINDAIWISTAASTAKTHNLRRDPRIVLCIDDPVSGDYVQITGRATLIEGDEVIEPTLAVCRKYMSEAEVLPHWQQISAEGPRVVIVVHPERFQWHDR